MLDIFKTNDTFNYSANAGYVTAVLILAYTSVIALSSFLLISIDHVSFTPYFFGLAQILFFVLPALYFSARTPVGKDVLLRLKIQNNYRFYLMAGLGLVALHLIFPGYTHIQESVMPESFYDTYIDMRRQVDTFYKDLFVSAGFFAGLMGIIIGAAIPGISEELIFRGYFQNSLEREMRPVWAILITGLLFGIIHFNLVNLLPLILIGVYLGVLSHTSGSILIPILVHFLNNAYSIALLHIYSVDDIISSTSEMSTYKAIVLMLVGSILLALVILKLFTLKNLPQTAD
jgi:uncharacterized protein